MKQRLVVIESPFAGDVQRNTAYAVKAMQDCLQRGEQPFASHLMYPLALDERLPEERSAGIEAGFAWGLHADLIVFYVDHGWSTGMEAALEFYSRHGIDCEVRRLYQQGWTPDARLTEKDVQQTLRD